MNSTPVSNSQPQQQQQQAQPQPSPAPVIGTTNPLHTTQPVVKTQQPPVQQSPTVTNHKTTPTNQPVNQPQEKAPVAAVQPTAPVMPHPPNTRQSVSLANVAPVPKKPTTSNNTIQLPIDNTFTDPLEHSLASLEQDIIKSEAMTSPLSNISSIPAIPNIPNINPTHHMPMMTNAIMPPNSMMHAMHSIENEMAPVIPPITTSTNILHSNNNGFGTIKQEIDIPMNNNGLSMGMPMNMAMTSIFDPLPTVTQPQLPINSVNLPIKKEEKPLIHPKPLEELSNPTPVVSGINNTDKKMTPPEQKASNFASAFKPKQEQNIKNASSWSSLAQANSPQNSSTGVSNRQMADSFQQFKKQAKEKADRQKALMEQQEMRRQQKEQAEKERLRAENERRREKEEEEALEKARYEKIY